MRCLRSERDVCLSLSISVSISCLCMCLPSLSAAVFVSRVIPGRGRGRRGVPTLHSEILFVSGPSSCLVHRACFEVPPHSTATYDFKKPKCVTMKCYWHLKKSNPIIRHYQFKHDRSALHSLLLIHLSPKQGVSLQLPWVYLRLTCDGGAKIRSIH